MPRSQEGELASLEAAIGELQQLDAAGLQRRWRSLVGGPLPADLGRPLTLRVLAYRIQARHLGDLDRASLRELSALLKAAGNTSDPSKGRLAEAGGKPVDAEAGAEKSVSAPGSRLISVPRSARPGTLLVREHGGVLHRVMILEKGVTWSGKTFDSLTQVALAITGTRWNGPRFFGLRGKPEDAAPQGRPKTGRAADMKKPVIGRGRIAGAGRSNSQRISP